MFNTLAFWLMLLSLLLTGCPSPGPKPIAPAKPNRGLAGAVWGVAVNPNEVTPTPTPTPKPDLVDYTQCSYCNKQGWLGDGQPRADCPYCKHPKWDTYFGVQGSQAEEAESYSVLPLTPSTQNPSSAGSPNETPSLEVTTNDLHQQSKGGALPVTDEHTSVNAEIEQQEGDAQSLQVEATSKEGITLNNYEGKKISTEELLAAHEQATANGKNLLVLFSSGTNCEACQRFITTVLPNPKVQNQFGSKLEVFAVDFNANPAVKKIFGVVEMPTMVVVSKDGKQFKSGTLLDTVASFTAFAKNAIQEVEGRK